jgi:hypothetical protein
LKRLIRHATAGVVHSKNAHGFAVKDLITIDGTGAFVKATSISDDVIGIVTYINSANKFTLQSSGFVDGLSALVAGTKYYVQSDGSLGTTITDKFYGKATSTTELMIISGGSTALTDALVFKGVIDCSANPNYLAGNAAILTR